MRILVFFLGSLLAYHAFAQDVITANVTDAMFVCGAEHPATDGPCAAPPRVISTPSPAYSEEARKARFEGTVVLSLVVGDDGTPYAIHVAKPLGMGLDEQAILAVRSWKFEPGTYQGKKVPVQISVEVSFHLYSGTEAQAKSEAQAKKELPKAAVTSTQQIENLGASAQTAYNNRNFRLAADLSRQLTELSPRDRNAWNLLGLSLLELHQFDDAIGALKKQIEIDPRSPFAYNNLGRVYGRQLKFDEAVKQFQAQININPDDRYAHANLGMMLRDEKKCPEALPELEKALTLTPNNPGLLVAMGQCNLDLGNKEKGLDDLNRATTMASTAGVWNDAAYYLASHNLELERAKKWAETAISVESAGLQDISVDHLSPAQMGYVRALGMQWDTLGWIYFVSGDAAAAEPYVRAAWQLDTSPDVGSHLAQIDEKLGRRDDAIREYAMALAAESTNPRVHTRPEIISEARDKLVKFAGPKADIPKLIEKGKSDLTAMRTVAVAKTAKASGTADFAILISPPGKVSDVRQLNGDNGLKPMTDALRLAQINLQLPAPQSASIVRRGTLTCVANQAQCKFVTLTASEAFDAARNEQAGPPSAIAKTSPPDPHVYDNPAMQVRISFPDGWRLVSEKPASYTQPAIALFNKVGTMAFFQILQEHLVAPPELYQKIVESAFSQQDDFTHTADEEVKRDGFSGTRWKMSWKTKGVTYQGILEFFSVGDQHYRVLAFAPVEVSTLYSQDFEDMLRSVQFPTLHVSVDDVLKERK